MNDLIYFPSADFSIEHIAEIALKLDYQYVLPDDRISWLTIFFNGFDHTSDISEWEIIDWIPDKWEVKIRDTLSVYSIQPNKVVFISFRSGCIKQITKILQVLLNQYNGLIWPEVMDKFILVRENLTEENMRLLYEKDYDDMV